MHTSMLSKARNHSVFSGNRKDMRGLAFPDATLSDAADGKGETIPIADVTLKGVNFRSGVALNPGKVHHLAAKGPNASSLASALRIVSCKLRADGEFDVSAEFF